MGIESVYFGWVIASASSKQSQYKPGSGLAIHCNGTEWKIKSESFCTVHKTLRQCWRAGTLSEHIPRSCRITEVCLTFKNCPYRKDIRYFPLAVCGCSHKVGSHLNHCRRQICNYTFLQLPAAGCGAKLALNDPCRQSAGEDRPWMRSKKHDPNLRADRISHHSIL